MTNRELLSQILKDFSSMDYIRPTDIPNIDLYMDQVTTFMEDELASMRRSPDDKTLTKTMINNYTKNHVLPSPNKKKYSREHMLTLILIYYLKSFLSIKDIQSILNPVTEKYFGKEDEENLSFYEIYDELVSMQKNAARDLMKDVIHKYNQTESYFSDAPQEEQEFLHKFSLVCMLAFDVYIKKMMIEDIIDSDPDFHPTEK